MADIKQITPENFDSIVNDSLPVLVDFWDELDSIDSFGPGWQGR